MPTYNHNNTPIFPQQSTGDWVSSSKGVGVYSNYQLQSRVQLLQDMPLTRHQAGDGRHPHDVQMSRWFRGLDEPVNNQPLANPGVVDHQRPTYYHFDHLVWQGVPSAQMNGGDYGHLPGRVTTTSRYSNWIYDGIKPQGEPLANPGHAPRELGDEGVAATFGRTNPMDHQSKALSAQGPLEDPGERYVSPDSHFAPKTWKGLPSARAL